MYLNNPSKIYWGTWWGAAEGGKERRERKKQEKLKGAVGRRKGTSELGGQWSEQYQNISCI